LTFSEGGTARLLRDNFWRERPVFVTGATGVIGSWLVRELVDRGAGVVCLIRDLTPRSHLVLSGYHARVTLSQGALEDYLSLERILNEYEIDTVFHLGAQTIVPIANRAPLATFEANIRGTWNVLEAARVHRKTVNRVVVASSDKAYGDHGRVPYNEAMALRGRHPYDVSKSCADLLAQAYAATYDLPLAITRCGNIYGGGDLNFSRIVPGTIRSALTGRRPVIRSDGSSVREYLYVRDAVEAYLTLARALDNPVVRGQAFNFSPDAPLTVLEVVRRILDLAGRSDLEPEVLGQASAEIPYQALSSTKARRVLGWAPRYSLDDGLRETLEWYRQCLAAEEVKVHETAATVEEDRT
jgi:CDP-glucose 4,6-dehydratase